MHGEQLDMINSTINRGQDKTANFKVRQGRRFCKREQIAIKIVSLIKKVSCPN